MSSNQDLGIDFNMVLMSSIHDVKNSLLMCLSTVETIQLLSEDLSDEAREHISQLQYELQRINNDAIQLLSLYKLDNECLALNLDQHNVYDFLEEQALQNSALNQLREVDLSVDCDDHLDWFFDRDLLAGVVNTIVNNALRYANSRIVLRGMQVDGHFELTVEDDGDGFPQAMLDGFGGDDPASRVDFLTGSTGLGLFFASRVAGLHESQGVRGRVELANGGDLGGGRFAMILP